MKFEERMKRMRGAGVPLVAIETEDQPNTVSKILALVNGSGTPVCQWDLARGLIGLNKGGSQVADSINQGKAPQIVTGNPSEMLKKVYDVEGAIVIMLNAHRVMDNPSVTQSVCNLREKFKQDRSMLVMLCPGITLPAELKQDVMIVTDPLPTSEEVGVIVKEICEAAEVAEVGDVERIADTLVGLSAFSGEQTLSTCVYLKEDNTVDIDRESLWETKCKVISQTEGLSILDDKENIDELDGCENVINFLKRLDGKYRGILLVDEVDKGMSAVNTDTSGTTQDQHSVFLTYMQDNEVDGCIFMGVPGSGKSAVAKAIAKHFKVVGMGFDMGATKSKFVGETGQKTRQVFRIIDAVTQGKVLIIATCNNMATLPPEFRRRFTMGTFFFDSPTDTARQRIWKSYEKKYGVTGDRPSDAGWTGAEIKQCCKLAQKTGVSLVEAGRYIVPVTVSAKEQIDTLRVQASGKFISAAKSGVYQKDEVEYVQKKARKIDLKNIES